MSSLALSPFKFAFNQLDRIGAWSADLPLRLFTAVACPAQATNSLALRQRRSLKQRLAQHGVTPHPQFYAL